MELSCGSPCACGIIHKAVVLSYASIKHHLQPAGAGRDGARGMRWEGEGKQKMEHGERGKKEGYNDGKAKKIVGVIDDGRSKRGKVGEKRSEEMSGR